MTVVHLGCLSLSFFFFSSAVFCWWGNERTEQQTINKQRRQTEQRTEQQINQRTNHKSGQQHARVHSVISEGRSGGACHLQHSPTFFQEREGGRFMPSLPPTSSEEPFHCPSCAAAEQQQIIRYQPVSKQERTTVQGSLTKTSQYQRELLPRYNLHWGALTQPSSLSMTIGESALPRASSFSIDQTS